MQLNLSGFFLEIVVYLVIQKLKYVHFDVLPEIYLTFYKMHALVHSEWTYCTTQYNLIKKRLIEKLLLHILHITFLLHLRILHIIIIIIIITYWKIKIHANTFCRHL